MAEDVAGWSAYNGAGSLPEGTAALGATLHYSTEDQDVLPITGIPLLADLDGDGDQDMVWRGYQPSAAGVLGAYAVVPGWPIVWP